MKRRELLLFAWRECSCLFSFLGQCSDQERVFFFEGAAVHCIRNICLNARSLDAALRKPTPTVRARRMKTNVGVVRRAHIHKGGGLVGADP